MSLHSQEYDWDNPDFQKVREVSMALETDPDQQRRVRSLQILDGYMQDLRDHPQFVHLLEMLSHGHDLGEIEFDSIPEARAEIEQLVLKHLQGDESDEPVYIPSVADTDDNDN